jgi:molybdenum cofactor cytidylyltransferase
MARVVGLLLAAGRGRRFAAELPAGPSPADKLLATIEGTPIARRALEALAAGCDAVCAVVRPDAPPALRAALAGARLVECAHADRGMGHSLAAAARAAADDGADAVLVMPADMPWVAPSTVASIAALAREGESEGEGWTSRIVVPALPDGRRGHPVAFGRAHLPALARLSGEHGARALLDDACVRIATVDDAGILRDVDTPRDLHAP